jgi:hypothetical protein
MACAVAAGARFTSEKGEESKGHERRCRER